MKHLGKVVVLAQHATKIVVRVRPRKRPGTLPAVTQQQVALWDTAQQIVKQEDTVQQALAMVISDNTAFYARDILISAQYGNYVSWPGFGMWPDGPTEGGVVDRVPGSRAKRLPPAPPRTINAARTITQQQWIDDLMTIDVDFLLPATTGMQMWMFCTPPQYVMTYQMKQGQQVPHGKKCWFPSVCGNFAPTSGSGASWEWSITPCCKGTDPCYLVFGELDSTGTRLMWTTLPYQCPPYQPSQTGAFLSAFDTTATIDDLGYTLFDQTVYTFATAPLTVSSQWINCPAGGKITFVSQLEFRGPPGTVGAAVVIDNTGAVIAMGTPSSGPGTPGWIVEVSGTDVPLGGATAFAFGLVEISPSLQPPFYQGASSATWNGP